MDDKLKESISALMDDEANELEVQRLLSKSDSKQVLDTWKRYHAARDVMSGMSNRMVEIDVASRVAAAIRGEEQESAEAIHSGERTPLDRVAIQTGSTSPNSSLTPGVDVVKEGAQSKQFWAFGGAIAACLVVAFGFTRWGEDGLRGGTQLATVNDASNVNQLVVNQLDESQVRSFNQYLLRHSELSAVTVASGVAPLVRVASVNSVGI